jgi:uncharacterized membrane protein YdjX (TVP38/TMEM64 family)
MMAIKDMLQEIAGLFVDDGWLALSILVIVALAAAISLLPGASLAAGGVLLFGCLVALVTNVTRAAR